MQLELIETLPVAISQSLFLKGKYRIGDLIGEGN